MRAIVLLDIDGTYDQCEEVLDQLEELSETGAALKVGRDAFVSIVLVQEAPDLDAKEAS